MPTVRKSREDIRAEGNGSVDLQKVRSFSDEDIERMAEEDGEHEDFDPDQKPTRVVRPFAPVA